MAKIKSSTYQLLVGGVGVQSSSLIDAIATLVMARTVFKQEPTANIRFLSYIDYYILGVVAENTVDDNIKYINAKLNL